MKDLKMLVNEYLYNCKMMKQLDKKTLKAYRIDLSQFGVFAERHPEPINKVTLTEYIALLHATYQPRTAKRKIATLKAFFHYLLVEELIESNPFDKINTSKYFIWVTT